MLCFSIVLSHVDWWLEVLLRGQSEASTPATVCVIVHHPAASLAVVGGGRSFMAMRGWGHGAWGAEGTGVFFMGASLFS
jgi:hypothetical protein